MELLIVADLVGMAGVESWAECDPTHPRYRAVLARYVAEVSAVASVAQRMGIRRVAWLDWHGRQLLPEELPPGISAVSLPFDERPRVAVLLGFHAATGRPDAFAPHTFLPGLRIAWDGRELGELALASRWLGEHGVPLLLVTGDRGLTREAEEWTDQTTTVAVKQARAPDRADGLPVERAHEAIGQALERVLERRSWWWVYRPAQPVRLAVQTPEGRSLAIETPSVSEALRELQRAFPAVALAAQLVESP
jgi:D-amino peptidase